MKDFNVKPETMKLLGENIDRKLLDTGLGHDFLDLTAKANAKRAKINKWSYIKLKSFCIEKETITKMKRQPVTRRRKLQVPYLIELLSYPLSLPLRKHLSTISSVTSQKIQHTHWYILLMM